MSWTLLINNLIDQFWQRFTHKIHFKKSGSAEKTEDEDSDSGRLSGVTTMPLEEGMSMRQNGVCVTIRTMSFRLRMRRNCLELRYLFITFFLLFNQTTSEILVEGR
jgi:hypothetical protein